MRFVFIQTRSFSTASERLGLTLNDVRAIENQISEAPQRWPVVKGVPGLRKMRYAPELSAAGKSGGIRVCYFVVDVARHVYLVTLFAKHEMENLSAADRNAVYTRLTRIRASYRRSSP
jgi:hypothetical protein